MRPAPDRPGELRRLLGLAGRAAAARTPAWLDLERRYLEWELAEAAEVAVRILRSRAPGDELRVHRALLSPSVTRAHGGRARAERAGTVVPLLLCCAAAADVRELCELPGEPALGDVAVLEPVTQLRCYAADFLDEDDPFAVLGEVPR
ncbi:hypothetical protein [Actinomadura rubrisoli]|uniref:Uncharacterized protein n=1 Tax=Actinomadura rubrisoli TaxID=2530368 RepID=A0A4R5ANN1_9ACTN|nr:hypothetical protein [Actinomadura rubrisoli]TDD73350.1 hypothetical protein E1298_34205 [Actinomadura rubrisoli]